MFLAHFIAPASNMRQDVSHKSLLPICGPGVLGVFRPGQSSHNPCGQAPERFNCDEGLSNWQEGWSAAKQVRAVHVDAVDSKHGALFS